jgi:hypothetical protein
VGILPAEFPKREAGTLAAESGKMPNFRKLRTRSEFLTLLKFVPIIVGRLGQRR